MGETLTLVCIVCEVEFEVVADGPMKNTAIGEGFLDTTCPDGHSGEHPVYVEKE